MDLNLPRLCDYGCGQEAKYQFKNGKWCCSKYISQCPIVKKKISESTKNPSEEKRQKNSEAHKGKIPWNKGKREIYSETSLKKMGGARKGKTYKEIYGEKRTKEIKRKKRLANKLTIKKIKEKYPFFSQIEEMRYNPDKPGEKEIQVHCKNHLCENSKERDGWFTPSPQQMKRRRDWLENEGIDICYFYCSQQCKNICPLYYSRGSDPLKDTKLPYTQAEKDIFNKEVLRRQKEEDGYNFCEKCHSIKKLHIHHEKPVKTHPHLALDPDNGIVLCQECHYKYGHKTGTECSTGHLANKIC